MDDVVMLIATGAVMANRTCKMDDVVMLIAAGAVMADCTVKAV